MFSSAGSENRVSSLPCIHLKAGIQVPLNLLSSKINSSLGPFGAKLLTAQGNDLLTLWAPGLSPNSKCGLSHVTLSTPTQAKHWLSTGGQASPTAAVAPAACAHLTEISSVRTKALGGKHYYPFTDKEKASRKVKWLADVTQLNVEEPRFKYQSVGVPQDWVHDAQQS